MPNLIFIFNSWLYTYAKSATIISSSSFINYLEMLQDRERFKSKIRVNTSPWAAALAGTKIKIDRNFTAAELGFERFIKVVLMQ